MMVIVHAEAFSARADRAVHLVTLLLLASHRRHDVLIHSDATMHWQEWLKIQGTALSAIFSRAVQDSQSRQALAPSAVVITVGDPNESEWEARPPRLHLLDAVELLQVPLEILVEDETSDGAFLDAVVPPPLRSAWEEARRERRVRFMTLGGVNQTPRRLEGERTKPPLSKRSFVLIDSDAPQPWVTSDRLREECWDALPPESAKAASAAKSVGLPIEVLDRRMAENYLPPAALRAWLSGLSLREKTEKRPHVEAFEQLARSRRHHHHLKRGLKPKEKALYGDLSAEAEAALSVPLGDRTWRAFEHVADSELSADGVYAELAPLFQRLLRFI